MLKICHKHLEWHQYMFHLNKYNTGSNMKKLLFVLLLTCSTQFTFSQIFSKEKLHNDARGGKGDIDNRTFSWGYYLGFNSLDFKFSYKTDNHKDINVKTSTGFNVGLIGNLKISDHFDLRLEPGLSFTKRILEYPESYSTPTVDFSTASKYKRETKSTYLYFPLLLKISTKRLNNFRPFILVGASSAINLSSQEKSLDDNSNGKFRMTTNPVFGEIGFGIDFYLYYFKFTPSIRGVFAMSDELIDDKDPNSPWTGNISQLQTRGFFINFTFQ